MKSFAHACTVSDGYNFGSDSGALHGTLSNGIDQDFSTSVYREIGPTKHMEWIYVLEWAPYMNVYRVTLKWTTYGDNSGGFPGNDSRLQGVWLFDEGGGNVNISGGIDRHSLTSRTDTWTGTWENVNKVEVGLQADTSNGGNGRGQIWELEVYGEFPVRFYSGSNTIYIGKNSGGLVRYGVSGSVEELAVGSIGDELETSVRLYDGVSVRVLAGLEE